MWLGLHTPKHNLQGNGNPKNDPGIDGIPNYVLKRALEAKPEIFCNVNNKCLDQGTFPRRWKRTKGPLCMRDSAALLF